MTITFATQPLPLATDADGVTRVGSTRVTLESVIQAFTEDATPEEIAQRYPTLVLADIYQVIGYFLRCPSDVEAYLQQKRDERQAVRGENEARCDPQGIRDRLQARRAPPGALSVLLLAADENLNNGRLQRDVFCLPTT